MYRKYWAIAFFVLACSNSIVYAQNDLDEGIFWGYQAWHLAKNDGRQVSPDQWYHWFDDVNTGNILGVDMYPDMSEYEVTYPTNLKYPDGSTATLYSAYDYETVDLHVQWMKEYGIKGLFLQRQNANITSAFQLEFRDQVTRHVIKACEKYGVKFCMMPCNNDKKTGGQQMIDKMINDWKHCVDDLKVLESPMYMKQNNKPVIGFWGLGFDNRPMLPSEAHTILDFYQNTDGRSAKYEVYVMGGVPRDWRTDPKEGGWDQVFLRLDMVSPWRTMFATQSDGVSLTNNDINRMQADIDYCQANNIDYAPVVSPGASTATQHDKADSFNWRKRSGGQFFWNQVYEICKAYKEKNVQHKFIYGAMFDEVDEGTAIYKMAATNEEAPAGTKYEVCTLDEDGYDLPNDWYLRVAGEAQKMLDGRLELSQTMSIDPNHPNNQSGNDSTVAVIPNYAGDETIEVHPVPASDVVYIEGPRIQRIQVFDITGNLLIDQRENMNQIDVSALINGIYLIRFTAENEKLTTRKIVVH